MIKNIKAREILNSKGNFTVEVELETGQGVFHASCPSGASKGINEAVEIKASEAVKNVNEIIGPKLKRKNPLKQKEIDEIMIELDGTENKSKLGANAILPVSLAVCRAGAAAKKLPLYQYIKEIENCKLSRLKVEDPRFKESGKIENWRMPRPCFNIINGGAHSGSDLEIQEFMVVPNREFFSENLRIGSQVYQELKKTLIKIFGKRAINIGDEGGFVPPISLEREALDLLKNTIREYQNIEIGLDCAASQFYKNNHYQIDGTVFSQDGLMNFYQDLVESYPIIFLEDPFGENDWDSFQEITGKFGKKIIIFGDDLLVTNIERIKEAKKRGACNGAIIKPNQIGTITETLEVVRLARSFGWKIMVSHRSGETGDDFIADLAVGISADFIKSGAPARGERIAKYNRLLKIESQINN